MVTKSLANRVFLKWISLNLENHDKIQIGITYLATNTLAVVQSTVQLLPLGRYLLPLTTLNRYQTRDSNGIFIFLSSSRNISIVRYWGSLVTILFCVLSQFTEFSESHSGKTHNTCVFKPHYFYAFYTSWVSLSNFHYLRCREGRSIQWKWIYINSSGSQNDNDSFNTPSEITTSNFKTENTEKFQLFHILLQIYHQVKWNLFERIQIKPSKNVKSNHIKTNQSNCTNPHCERTRLDCPKYWSIVLIEVTGWFVRNLTVVKHVGNR